MSASVLVRRLAGLAVPILVVAACGEANVDASTTSPADSSSTTSTVITSTTSADATTTTESTTTTEAVTGQIVGVVFASADQSDCSNTETFQRIINEAADPIESAFQLLGAGPTTGEQTTGAGSFFSSDTEGMVRFAHRGTFWGDRPTIGETLEMIETDSYSFTPIQQRK